MTTRWLNRGNGAKVTLTFPYEVQCQLFQVFYVDREQDLTFTEVERTSDTVRSKLRPKTTGQYNVI